MCRAGTRSRARVELATTVIPADCPTVILVSGSKYCYHSDMSTVRKVSIALPDDMVAIAREALANPQWPLQARQVLLGEGYENWPVQAGWWLERRAPVLRHLQECGDDPRQPRYETPIDGTQYNPEELDTKA